MSMKYMAAYLLAHTAGVHKQIDGKVIKTILDSVGSNCDDKEVEVVLHGIKQGDGDVESMLSRGLAKLFPAAPAAVANRDNDDDDHDIHVCYDSEPYVEEESDPDLGFGLFD